MKLPPHRGRGRGEGAAVPSTPAPSPSVAAPGSSLSRGAGEGLTGPAVVVPDAIRDLPSGAALLALGREHLLEHVLPLLPPERHRELRLVATAMAIAEREAEAGDAPAEEIAGAAAGPLRPRLPPAERAEMRERLPKS